MLVIGLEADHIEDLVKGLVVDTFLFVTLMDARLQHEDFLEVTVVHVANTRLVADRLTLYHFLFFKFSKL